MAKNSRRNRKGIEASLDGYASLEDVREFSARQGEEEPKAEVERKQKEDFVKQIFGNNLRLREIILSSVGRKLIPETRLFEIINKIRTETIEKEVLDSVWQAEPEQSDTFIELDILVDAKLSEIIGRDFPIALETDRQAEFDEKIKPEEFFWAGEYFSMTKAFVDKCVEIIREDKKRGDLKTDDASLNVYTEDFLEVFRERYPDFPQSEEMKGIVASYFQEKIKK